MKHNILSRILPYFVLLSFLQGCSRSPNSADFPIRTAKPYTRWWWFAMEIQESDIRLQLEWLEANGFGGVEIAWIYPPNRDPGHPRIPYLGARWSELVSRTKQIADSLGLGCDFTFGSLWPFGGTFVKEKDRTRIFGDPDFKQQLRLSWEHPAIGNVINHMDRNALFRYAEVLSPSLLPAMKGTPSCLFCDSWEVETRRIWTEGFERDFLDRFGYDITPYMEGLYQPENADVHYDYMKLVSEYVIREFYSPFTGIAHRMGGYSRVQCAGSPTDLIEAYSLIDVPESEAMLYDPSFSRIPASSACLSGRPVVSSETFTCMYGFPNAHFQEEQTADLKLVADALFANGVNHIIWHGMPFQPKNADTLIFYATVHVGKNGALSQDLLAFNQYLETVAWNLRRGKTYSDVAILLPLEDAWMAQEYPDSLQMRWSWGEYELRYVNPPGELLGYHPLWINREFLKRARFTHGRIVCGNAEFQTLYVDSKFLDLESLSTILSLARRGLPICLKSIPLQPGKIKEPSYLEMMNSLQSLPNVSPILKNIHPKPPLVGGEEIPEYWCRSDEDTLWIFFANPKTRGLGFPLLYGQSLGMEDRTVSVTVHFKDAMIPIQLCFEPHQSLLYRIHGKTVTPINIEYSPRKPVFDPNPAPSFHRKENP